MHHAKLEWLTPNELTVLPNLQRKVGAARYTKIGRNWDIGLVGVLEGARLKDDDGNEIVHLIDGQTRKLAAEVHGEENGSVVSLPVVIYDGLSRKDVARLFLARNQLSSKVSAYHQYMVGIEADDEVALTIQKAFAGSTFVIDTSATAYQVAAVGAVMAVTKQAIRLSSKEEAQRLITLTLGVLHDAWPYEEGDRVNGDIFRSVAWMFSEHQSLMVGLEHERFVEMLSNKTPREWALEAKQKQSDSFSSGQRFKYIVELWTKAYNRNIGNTKLDKLG